MLPWPPVCGKQASSPVIMTSYISLSQILGFRMEKKSPIYSMLSFPGLMQVRMIVLVVATGCLYPATE